MKRFFATALSLALAASLLAGCSSNLPKGYSPFGPQASSEGGAQQPQENPAPENPVQVPAGAELSTGLAVINSVGSSKDAGDEDGLAQADSNVVAVRVDADGRIVDCKIDGVQAKIPFSKEGKLLVGTDTMFRTKQELKEEYGMKKASGIGREWNEQADALAAYVTGKTLDEIRGIAVTEDGHAGDAELASSVTMSVGGWLETVEKAVANAKPMGAKTGDRLGLGIETNMSKSTDAGDEDGLAQAYSMYTAATFGPDGRITSCILDGSQSNVNFDRTGKITTDLTVAPQTKNELKEAYGMKVASGIGLEWYQQAENYAQYALGKTPAELSGLAVNDHGSPTDAELAASVTIGIGDFNAILQKAAENAGAASLSEGGLMTGLAVINSVGSSKDAGDEDGLAQADSNVVAVLVDADGRIVDCKIDGVQAKIPFSKEGKLLVGTDTMFRTKQELKEEYGMKKASGIGREWNEQADALAAYVTGKTLDEIRGIAVTEDGHAGDAELASSVTMSVGGWLETVEKAVANAKPMGAKTGDRLGLGIETNMSKSTDAGDEDGLAQAYSMYTAATFGPDGRITSCILDGSQSNVNFDRTGKITTDLTVAPQTKNELKEAYGMKVASGIGLEWYQQAENYAQYALGKTPAELSGLAVNDHGSPTDAELAASVTIGIGDFNTILQKAAENAG